MDIAHVVVMPNVTREKIDTFVKEYLDVIQNTGHIEIADPKSPLATLKEATW